MSLTEFERIFRDISRLKFARQVRKNRASGRNRIMTSGTFYPGAGIPAPVPAWGYPVAPKYALWASFRRVIHSRRHPRHRQGFRHVAHAFTRRASTLPPSGAHAPAFAAVPTGKPQPVVSPVAQTPDRYRRRMATRCRASFHSLTKRCPTSGVPS